MTGVWEYLVCTSAWPQLGFKTAFSTPSLVHTYLYTQRAHSGQWAEILCRKRTLTSRLWARAESNFEGSWARRVGWPCSVSDSHLPLPCCRLRQAGATSPSLWPLVGDTVPQCVTGTEPSLSKGFFYLWFRDTDKEHSGDNFWWHDQAGLGSSGKFIRGEIPLPGPLATEC